MKLKLWVGTLIAMFALNLINVNAFAEEDYSPVNNNGECEHHRGHHKWMLNDLSKIINTSKDDLRSYQEKGLTLRQVIEKAGQRPEEVKKQLLKEAKVKLDQNVEEGWMTEKKRDWILEKMSEEFENQLDQPIEKNDQHKQKDQ
ncbi:hypothetical protein GLW08_02505 [Pontibacillus yanchengensis]|uniref:Uncharacterized protein n=2 Tax=Pontibacillus yanchengensis TaxID=462910 RepID=A0ACC7VBH1_9BACI|nr:hypothetical protein [Pontibacillus yanchengensis]MYL34808.1 hypothetical protein [Pontibacillus yanchengensis]MYL52206.1 hypothetical protein [Pontibacillus yanchengensis]